MWDRSASKCFTKAEAKAYVGRTVDTSAGCKATIKGVMCDGPRDYLLVDERGGLIYKSHNNCVYVID